MTQAARQRLTFEEYSALDAEAWVRMGLPEGRCEYWDGELIELPTESGPNVRIANFLLLQLINASIPFTLVYLYACEIEVPGRSRTRYPDLVVLQDEHLAQTQKRLLITREMAPPQLAVEVVSPGDTNRKRDYEAKRRQYQERGRPEFWLVDPEQQIITVLTLEGDEYQEFGVFEGEMALSSAILGPLPVTVQQIFSAGDS